MGTHPIFESDFDCLTERSWRRQRFVKNNSLNQVEPKSEIDDLFSRATEHRSSNEHIMDVLR